MLITSPGLSANRNEAGVASVADLLPRAADRHAKRGLYVAIDEQGTDTVFLAYPELLAEARRILGGLQRRLGAPGARVVLLLERPKDFIPTFWACVLGGYIPCPVAPIRGDTDRWGKHLAHIDGLLRRPLFVSAGELLRDLPDSIASADLTSLQAAHPAYALHRPKLDDVAILMLTSGSTGNSKAVELTHGNLLASLAGRAERQQLTSADTLFNWIAFDHVAALLESHMIALYVGASQLHTEPVVVLTDPLRFLSLIHRHRVSVAFAPNFLLGQVNAALSAASAGPEGRAMPFDLSGLRHIVTGGEANVVETGTRFLKLLAPYGLNEGALWPAFGMTETCAASVYSEEFPAWDVNSEFAAVGLPLPGLEIRITTDGAVSPVGESGELQLRGPMIFRRYHNNEEATRAAFTSDGWFCTGDIGRVEEGRLRLIARNKDSIIVNGVNYFSQELETKLEQFAGIERSFVAAFPTRPKGADTEKLVVAFATVLAPEDEDRLYQLVVAIRNTTIMLWGFRPALILPLPKSAFPKTSLGKIQRSLMRKQVEAGTFDADIRGVTDLTRRQVGPHTVPESPEEETLAAIFAEILGTDLTTISATASFFDLGGTSLDILKLARSLQRRFGLKATVPLVLQNPTIRNLAARVLSGEQQTGKYNPLVPLQSTGTKSPLFCVHPGNGEVFALVNVAKYFLNDRPFYALRPRGFNEGEECFKSIGEAVDSYVEAIVERQPEGPYAIAGYSLGCPIAFEVAKELERRGNKMAFLGCIDSGPCHQVTSLDFNMATGLALVIDLISLAQFETLNKELRPELPSNEVCDYVLSFASPKRLAELDLDPPRFETWARVAHTMESLLFAHVNSGTISTMTVFCGEGISSRYSGLGWTRQTWRNELNRWSAFADQCRYVEVAGDHHSLMGPKHVASFQALLRTEIDRGFTRF